MQRTEFFVSLGHFLPFDSPNNQQNKNFEKVKQKKRLEILSYNTSVPKTMIICFTVPDIWHVIDVIVVFHFGLFFLFYPSNSQKNENFKQKKTKKQKKKKHLEISSFYTRLPKIMILCFTVPEIWHITDVIVIFDFGLFLHFYPPTA